MLEEDVLPKQALCLWLLSPDRQMRFLVLGWLSHQQATESGMGEVAQLLVLLAAVILGPSIGPLHSHACEG